MADPMEQSNEVKKNTNDHDEPFDEAEHKEFSAWFLQYEDELFNGVKILRHKLKARRSKLLQEPIIYEPIQNDVKICRKCKEKGKEKEDMKLIATKK